MQISLKLIRLINHAKRTVCIKFQLLVIFSSLFTDSSITPALLRTYCTSCKSLYCSKNDLYYCKPATRNHPDLSGRWLNMILLPSLQKKNPISIWKVPHAPSEVDPTHWVDMVCWNDNRPSWGCCPISTLLTKDLLIRSRWPRNTFAILFRLDSEPRWRRPVFGSSGTGFSTLATWRTRKLWRRSREGPQEERRRSSTPRQLSHCQSCKESKLGSGLLMQAVAATLGLLPKTSVREEQNLLHTWENKAQRPTMRPHAFLGISSYRDARRKSEYGNSHLWW